MRASVSGQQELAMRVQQALALATKKEAQMVVDAVVTGLESTLLNNLVSDGFTLKLGSFGKFSVRHKTGILRKIRSRARPSLRRIDGRSHSSAWGIYGSTRRSY